MAHYLLIIFTLSIIQTSYATSMPSKAYWNEHLPNTPMPSILEAMLPKSSSSNYDFKGARAKFNSKATLALYSWYDYEHESPASWKKNDLLTSIFIRPQDLKAGHNVDIKYMGPNKLGPPFMRRDVVEKTLPFSSKNMGRILAAFSIKPNSPEVTMMRSTLARCEEKREEHLCVSSMESMVDYVTSQLGKSVTPLSVTVTPEMETMRRYTIVRADRIAAENVAVSCHKASFPYGVFYCHKLTKAVLYHVELYSADEPTIRVNTALASCHHDTASWNPLYAGFKVLGIQHGQPLCHFLHADNVVWLPKA